MRTSLNDVLTAPGLLERLSYTFYPWGNAYYNTSACGTAQGFDKDAMFCWAKECGGAAPAKDCFTGTKLCQHGEDECAADALEACVINIYDAKDFSPFVTCFEGHHRSRLSSAQKCAEQSALNYSLIAACAADASQTAALDAANAKATAALGTSKLGTPWVVLDGEQVDPSTLLNTVCAKLTPPLPKGCGAGKVDAALEPALKGTLC